MNSDNLYTGCNLATMSKGQGDYGLIENASFVVRDKRVIWVGAANELPASYSDLSAQDLGQRLVTPALIDCHTHIIFGGNRAREFEMRLQGASYEDIARQGGGIRSTVLATRQASDQELLEQALKRLDYLIREGVAVIEVKSGYGLTVEDEIRMLRIARQLAQLRPVKIVTAWLAAHTVPAEYTGRPDDYIDEVAIPGLKIAAAQGLVDIVDGFCETIAFSAAQIERVFTAAEALSLPVKLHAEQLSDQKGALLLGKYKGLSADHLEFLAEEDVATFAHSGAVAVLLPGAYYTLRETKCPPIEHFRTQGVDMAVATDCNPGSSPVSSILTVMNMACTEFSMTPEEALAGVTRCAAKALGLSGQYGVIEPGAVAKMAVWDVEHPAELSYWVGASSLHKSIS